MTIIKQIVKNVVNSRVVEIITKSVSIPYFQLTLTIGEDETVLNKQEHVNYFNRLYYTYLK